MKTKKLLSVLLAMLMLMGIGWPQTVLSAFADVATYQIVFHGNGGVAPEGETITKTVECGKIVTLSNMFTLYKGYGFQGWSVTLNGDIVYTGTSKVTDLAEAGGSYDLYAVWLPYYYSVSYNLNGADGEIQSEYVSYDAYLANVQDVSRTGYDFLGWNISKSSTAKYAPGEKIKNVTVPDGSGVPEVILYAIWKVHTATVVFDANGGTGTMEKQTLTYNAQNNLTANAFKKTGYTFVGWSLTPAGDAVYANAAAIANEDTVFGLAENTGNEVTLYAVWRANSYTVSYNLNGYDATKDDEKTSYDKTLTETAAPLRPGYQFAGWALSATAATPDYKAGAEIKNLTSKDGGSAVLYAVWQANTYSVVYKANGTEGEDVTQTITYDKKTALKANTFVKTGYLFTGWSETENGGKKYTDAQYVTNLTAENKGVITLYAVWEPITYTVKYNVNGMTGEIANETGVFDADLKNAKVLSRTGYTFLGWNTKNTTYAKYAPGEAIGNLTQTNAASVTLYAIWQTHTYIVSFNANGGTGDMAKLNMTYDVAATLTSNTFKKTGYTFKGWSTTPGGKAEYTNKQTVSNLTAENGKAITLYAVWEANTYSVVYNGNGASNVLVNNTQTFTYDKAQALWQTPYRKAGYIFTGWTLEKGKDVVFTDGQTVNNIATSGTVTLIAVWVKAVIGDVNLDNKVAAEDARLALRAAVGLETLTENQITVADVDKDAKVTAADARLILRAAVGLETLK